MAFVSNQTVVHKYYCLQLAVQNLFCLQSNFSILQMNAFMLNSKLWFL
jgi:hypothetical protein